MVIYGKLLRPWSSETSPQCHTTTTTFDCWYDVQIVGSCVLFMPDETDLLLGIFWEDSQLFQVFSI